MKQLVILSGKGGTGKTSIAAAFAHLAYRNHPALQAVLVDADVDAANLELVLQPCKLETHVFVSGETAVINQELCSVCGTCLEVCRFEAVLPPSSKNNFLYQVDPIACDGCAACMYHCPSTAIQMQEQQAGRWFKSESRYGPLFHAELLPARENSGKLVTLVRQQARLNALDSSADLVIIDGPPGIGCPVIAAASGADLVLVVSEPTAAGIHDMMRILDLTRHFRMDAVICMNKADLYPIGAEQILQYCIANEVEMIGSIPFDDAIPNAMTMGKPVSAHQPLAPSSQAIAKIWDSLLAKLGLVS